MDPRRVAVDGSVIALKQLIPTGTIRFLPQAGTQGPIVLTSVKGGLYRLSKKDGPFPGRYKVVVNVELEYAELAALNSSESVPAMMWEDEVTLPEQDSVTQHFLWEETPGKEKPVDVK